MTSKKLAHLENVRAIQTELAHLIEGMDYCLDWKPDPSEWSPREVLYHLVDTPSGGIHSVVRGILSGEVEEFDLWSDESNITPERQGYDAAQVQRDVSQILEALEESLEAASDEDLAG